MAKVIIVLSCSESIVISHDEWIVHAASKYGMHFGAEYVSVTLPERVLRSKATKDIEGGDVWPRLDSLNFRHSPLH